MSNFQIRVRRVLPVREHVMFKHLTVTLAHRQPASEDPQKSDEKLELVLPRGKETQ